MDDYNISSLQESNNEWVNRLVSILTPNIINGSKILFNEAYKICGDNDESEKYLMTFQNLLSRIPKWNNEIVNKEIARIKEASGCDYLEDLITCVHIINLKALTCARVGMKHKTIDIDIPKLDQFIHQIYILLARKIYTNVYLFEENIAPLQVQRNHRELELICKECILNAIRESIPIESILRSYLDETVEENVETIMSTNIEVNPESQSNVSSDANKTNELDSASSDSNTTTHETKSLTFSNIDEAQNTDKSVVNVHAPKDIETLEKISTENHLRQLLQEQEEEEEEEQADQDKIKIMDDTNITLNIETL